ncbi:MAG: GIDE domain-containing protein, partial [Armatimonadota bacterium]|nr:GIDE domain-containing protein [Armatimonadota bacterium]
MAYAGIALLALGVVLILVHRAQQRKLSEVVATETTAVSDLQALARDFRERGGGVFQYQTELKGVIECAAPLTSELGGERCVAYRTRVERHWEEDYWETNPRSGRRERRTRQGTDVVAANERRVPFLLRDATGVLEIDPQGAELECVQSVDRFVA